MHSSPQLVIVVTTVASHDDAERIAHELINSNLAACVQIDGPVSSHYHWDGTVQTSTEYRLTLKTNSGSWQTLKEQLTLLHPYDEPEILMFPVTDTTEGYLEWVNQHTLRR
jgi:periplasmic divalent cation tolerance protein